ncbi:hypothetical protein NF681_00190 (plasmid) [Comamonadaceae bacterium OTU4NAUVB1]|nr:hypothetical protein NF681_00190 [Comamonadaceae bacterium OTU4NAUVB1]
MRSLAWSCTEATLKHMEGSADELKQASALLADAMAVLRSNFAAAFAATTGAADRGECRRHLEAAMVALQSEDALVQMLDGVRERTLQTADVLRYVVMPRSGEADVSRSGGGGRTAYEATASRLRLAVIALDASIVRSGRVRQTRAVAGSIDLF